MCRRRGEQPREIRLGTAAGLADLRGVVAWWGQCGGEQTAAGLVDLRVVVAWWGAVRW